MSTNDNFIFKVTIEKFIPTKTKDADEKMFFRGGEINSVAELASSDGKCEVPGAVF
jgi:hypothetical protein